MISLKCSICSGELTFRDDRTLICPYCGNTFVMSGEEMSAYGKRRREVLRCLSQKAGEDERAALLDRIWEKTGPISLRSAEGEPISVACLYEGSAGSTRLLSARRSQLIVYPKKSAENAQRFNQALRLLRFPPTDTNRLAACFPQPGQIIPLDDGGAVLALGKPEDMFPLAMFGALPPEHAAWITSRLENICCVLAYSGLRHGNLHEDHILINPWTHQAALYGGWEFARPGSGHDDLVGIRKVIRRVMGPNAQAAPRAFMAFLHGAPQENAYDDFAVWDQVIENGFGGRRFAEMNIDSIL